MSEWQKARDAFYEHLDRCEQCREQPFGLCRVGNRLLIATALQPINESGETKNRGTE